MNTRPLPYQGSALPLSYGGSPGRGLSCHTAAGIRKHGVVVREDDRKSPKVRPDTAEARTARERRLAEEMRANLIKRKAQQRAQGSGRGRVPAPRDDRSS